MAKVEIILQGTNNASSAIDETSNALKGLGGVADSVGGALGGLGGIAQTALGVFTGGALLQGATAIVGKLGELAGSPLDAWRNLDEAADTLTLKLGATGPALDTMTASVQAIYNSSAGLGENMGQIASTMGTLGQITGATGDTLQGLTSQLGYMKQVQGEGAVGAEEFARTLQAWNVPAEQGGALLDQMAVATQKFGISSADMSSGLLKAAGAFQGMGLSVDQSMGLMAGFYAGGLNTEKAIMAMSTAAGKFAKDGVDMRTGLEGAVEAIKNAGSATEATKIAVETFGAKAGPGLATAIQQGKFSLDGLSGALGDTTGALQKTAEATMDFPEKLELMKRKVETSLAPLGAAIASGLGTALDAMGPIFDNAVAGLAPLIQNVGSYTQALTAAALGQESFGAVLGPVGDTIDGLIPVVTSLATQTRDTLAGAFQFIMGIVQQMQPGLQSLASAVGQTLVAAWQAFQQIGTAVFTALQPYLPALQSAINQVAQVLGSTLNGALQGISSFLTGTVIPAISTFAGWLSANLPGAMAAVAGFISGTLIPAFNTIQGLINQYVVPALSGLAGVLNGPVGQAVKDVAGFVANVLVAAWQGLVNFIQGAMPTMSGAVTGAFQIIGGAIQTVSGVLQTVAAVVHGIITGDWDGAWRDAQAGVQTALDGIKQILSGAIDEVRSIVTSIMNGIASAITGKKTDIVGEMAATATAAWDAFTSIDWGKLGGDIIAGIARGIENGASAIKDAALNAARAALEAAKNFLGISSPSKAAAEEIGQPLAAGIAVGIMGGADLVAQGLRQLLAGGLAAGVDAMHQLASAFRAVFNAFSGSADGIGGNAVNHVRRLINAISEITGSVQDFLKMLGDLEAFAGSSAAGLALSSGGQDFLSSLFASIAHLAQRMALSARQAAEGFINSEVGATLTGLAQGIAGIKAVVEAVVGNVTSLLDATAGGGLEQLMNGPGAQWIINVIGGIVAWAVRINATAQQAVGTVPAATASLKNLADALQPLSGAVTAVTTTVKAVVEATYSGEFESLMNGPGRQRIVNVIGAIVSWAVQINAAAQAAVGTIPEASASLTNLNNALQPLTGVITSTVGVLKALNDAIQSSVVTGAISGPMSEFWQALYKYIATRIVAFAVQLASAAQAAAGTVPAATASLTNLSNALQPFTTVITATTAAIVALHGVIGNSVLQGALTGGMSETWQALYEFIATRIVTFAVGIAAAANAAVGTVPAATSGLTNLSSALSPLVGAIKATLEIADLLVNPKDAAVLNSVLSWTNTPMGNITIARIIARIAGLAGDIAREAGAAVGSVAEASASLGNLAGALSPLDNVIKAVMTVAKLLVSPEDSAVLQSVLDWTNTSVGNRTIAAIIGRIAGLAGDIARAAAAAVGSLATANTSLSDLADALSPLDNVIKAVMTVAAVLVNPKDSAVLQSVLDWTNTPMGNQTIAAIIARIAGLAGDIARAASAAIGGLASANTSLSGLADAITPLVNVIEAVMSVAAVLVKPDNIGVLNSVLDWSMTEIGKKTIAAIIGRIAALAAEIARQASAAIGTIGAASDSLKNLADTLSPLTTVLNSTMGLADKLVDWKPVSYDQISGRVASLIESIKGIAKAVVTAAQQANISADMQKAADALLGVAGPGMDALGKAMSTIKALFEFSIESGPGWVQQQGGNNIWSQGGVSSGLPSADAIRAKVDALMAGLKAIMDSVRAGIANISLGEDATALKAKLDAIAGILADAASIVKSAQELASGGAAQALSIAIKVAFVIPDLAAEIEAIPIPVIHIPVVWDVPPLPGGTSGGGGSSTPGPATPSSGGTTYNNVNVNLSTAAGLPGTLSMISNMAR